VKRTDFFQSAIKEKMPLGDKTWMSKFNDMGKETNYMVEHEFQILEKNIASLESMLATLENRPPNKFDLPKPRPAPKNLRVISVQ
jgi:hypothetical protein